MQNKMRHQDKDIGARSLLGRGSQEVERERGRETGKGVVLWASGAQRDHGGYASELLHWFGEGEEDAVFIHHPPVLLG